MSEREPLTPHEEIIVGSSDDGWEPSRELIEEVRAAAREKGLISDWPVISALNNHDLLLCCTHVTGEHGSDLIATKRSGKWTFKTDGEEMGTL
jgi:hypothetical protein